MIARLASALRRTARIALERPRALIWSTLALTCAFVAVGIATLGALSVDRWNEQRPDERAGLVVYLGEGVSDARAQALIGELRTLRGVERVELVPAAESAKRLVASLGSGAALLEGVDIQALPASVEVTLAPGVRDVVAMSPMVRELRGAPGVADVVIEDAANETHLAGKLDIWRQLAWSIASLFAGLALLAALGAIRLRLDRGSDGLGRRELEIVDLLGGGRSFLGVPIALAGALQGMVAALLAAAVVLAGLYFYGESITASLGTLGHGDLALAQPTIGMVAMFVGGGAALGLVGGSLAAIRGAAASWERGCGALA